MCITRAQIDLNVTTLQGVKVLVLDPLKCAYLSGVTDDDVIKMYALVHNMIVGVAKRLSQPYSSSVSDRKEFEPDLKTAAYEQKPLILAVRRKA